MHFFIHNSFQAGDVVLTRPLIEAIRANFQGVSITLETTQNNAYLWKDLGLPIAIYEGIEYHSTASTPNCPPGVVFVNMCFDLFDDIFATYGITYENQVHTFNRQICGYNLQHNYQLAIPQQTPMIKFYYVEQISGFKENGILLEGNEYLPQLAQDFPNLTFYCIEKPSIQMPNIIDCSKFNLIELSVIGNRCIGLIVKNGAVNAITLTEMNRHKPRCIVERNFRFKLWNISEKNTVYTERYSQVKDFFSFAFQISQNKLCKFLKSERDVEECTRYLHQNGYVSHNISFKDWDLAHIINDLSDGNFLDMGSSDSYILKNAVIKGIKGEKYGIDLRHPDVPVIGVKYIIGDLMNTEFPDNYFANITCLSVIEHEVDFNKFAAEIKRLLMVGGKIYLTFDYWTPKITPKIKLYGLAWNILDKNDTEMLIKIFNKNNLHLIDEVDWSLGEALITEKNYSPEPGIHYTFGMLVFQKNTGGATIMRFSGK